MELSGQPSRYEQPISSVDEDLVFSLFQIDRVIDTFISTAISEEQYADYHKAQALNALTDDLIDQSLQKRWREHQAKRLRSGAHQLARARMEADDMVFDEDDERYNVAVKQAYYDQMPQFLKENSFITLEEQPYLDARAYIVDQLTDELESLLVDRYPTLNVVSVDAGILTFYGREELVHERVATRRLMISFSVEGKDITTRAAYAYTPLMRNPEFTLPNEELDIAILEEGIEGISLDRLKRDTLRALQIVLSTRL